MYIMIDKNETIIQRMHIFTKTFWYVNYKFVFVCYKWRHVWWTCEDVQALKSCVVKNHTCVMVHVQVDYTSHVQITIQLILCNQIGYIETNFVIWNEELILYVFETNNDNVEMK
jgi:hypothetical protein